MTIDNNRNQTNNNNISKDIVSSEYYYIKKVKPPILDDYIITCYKSIIDNNINISNKLKKKTLFVGVIKFKDNENIEYIHCPLIGIDNISIGVCSHFESVKNDSNGKKHLASHKYQYHCKCKSKNKNNSNFQIFLKTTESIENVLLKKYSKQLNINQSENNNEK
jgi:hypothetical protein